MKTIFTDKDKTDFVPEMGCVYNKNTNNPTCAMVGYFDSPSLPAQFDLHLINTFLNECEPLERTMIKYEGLTGSDLETYFVPTPELNMNLIINRNLMNLDDEDCDD